MQSPSGRARARTLVRVAAAFVGALGVIATLVAAPERSAATTITPFDVRFRTNDNGVIAVFGNNVLTCAPSPTCTSAREGTTTGAQSSNNGFTMVNLDEDGAAFPATFNSSNVEAPIPATASVLFAGLYWGARRVGASGGTTTTAPIDQMSLRVPGASDYQTITADDSFGPTPTADQAYQQFADVTGLVSAAGAGTYWGANVAAGTGTDRYGGWSLVIVLRDSTQPLRNLTVFDGFSDVGANSSETINISGFLAPLAGAVDARLALVAYEGDKGGTGDQAFLNTTRLATALSPGTNFFNGSNDRDGQSTTDRQPADVNMLGFDIMRLGVSGAIGNGDETATVELSTNSERYLIGVVTTAINLYAPDFTTSRKAVTNLSGHTPAIVGDVLEYTLTYTNTGADPASANVASDELPADTSFVPGSLEVVSGPNAGVKTDALGDDQVEFDAASRTIVARLGTGANDTVGGVIAPGGTTSVRFRVTIDDAASGTTVTNRAELDYVAQTIGDPFVYGGNETATPVTANADLRVTKSTSPDPTAAGADTVSVITIVNDGPNTAVDAIVTDTLSAGIDVESAIASVGSCDVVDRDVTCTLGDLASSASATVTITAAAPSGSAVDTFSNTARVASSTTDSDLADNAATATVSIVQRADLTVVKGTPAAVAPGGLVTYPITILNNGPSDASTVRLTDALPAALTFVSATAPCAEQSDTVQCPFGTLTAGQSTSVTITARVDPSLPAGVPITNTATGSSVTPDPEPSDNSATATFATLTPLIDLELAKSATPTNVVAGDGDVTYSLTVTNDGPSDATDVVVSDPMTSGFPVTAATASQGDCIVGPPVSCTIGALAAGATATVSIAATVGPDVSPGPVGNSATVAGAQADGDPADNTASAPVQVTGSADVFVVKAGEPQLVPGPTFYQIQVANSGPSTARDVVLVDPLPPALEFDSVVLPDPSTGTCAVDAGQLRCEFIDLPPDAVFEVVVFLDVPTGYDGTPITNTATVTTATPDRDPTNDRASFTSSADPQADLTLSKTRTPPILLAGGPVSWEVRVFNSGPFEAADVQVTDNLPVDLVDVDVPPECTLAGSTVTCDLDTVPVGSAPPIVITARIPADAPIGTPLNNTATVTSSTPDPSATGNSDTAPGSVHTAADITVTKTTDTPSAPAGAGLPTFTITVANDGPSVASNILVTDTLPFDAIIETVTGADCTISGTTVDCRIPTLAPLPAAPTEIVVSYFTRTTVAPGIYTNTASANSSTTELDPTDNTGSIAVEVLPPAVDVRVAKSGPPVVVAGGTFDYRIDVQNDGPSTAFDVVVTDTLPLGFTPEAATAESGRCTIGGQTVTCTLDFVYEPPFQTDNPPILISGTVDPNAPPTVTNVASAVAVEPDSDPGNNIASIDTSVRHESNITLTKLSDSEVIFAGGEAAYTITVTNAGPSAADAAQILDTLPAGVTFDPEVSDSRCAPDPPGSDGLVCALGTLDPGTTTTLRIVGHVDADALAQTLVNTASFSSNSSDPDESDNIATVETPVEVLADLVVTKTATSETVVAGETATFNVTVTNQGPARARDVTVTDQLPAGTVLIGAMATPPVPCSDATCTLGDLEPGESMTATITVAVPADTPPGPIVNVIDAASPSPDPNPQLRHAEASTQVVRSADIAVTKRFVTDPVIAGAPVTFEITVTNNGPSIATNTTFVDPLPPGTTVVGVSPPPLTECGLTGGGEDVPTITCVAPILPVGETLVGTLTLATDPAMTGILENVATIGAQALDARDADNEAGAVAPIVQAAGLTVDKVANTPTVAPGAPSSFTITVTNPGPSVAQDVVVTDVLPPGLDVESVVSDPPTPCVELTCELGDMSPSESVTLDVVVRAPSTPGTFTNRAVVTSPTPAFGGERSASATVVVVADPPPPEPPTSSTAPPTTVPPEPPPATTNTTAAPGAPPPPVGVLPSTGATSSGINRLAVLALIAGLVAYLVARRPTPRSRGS